MSRRAVVYKNASQYNLLHTTKVTLWNGNVVTALYNLKETAKFYTSMSTWGGIKAFKAKKENVDISVDIPIITDEKTIHFLEISHYVNYVDESHKNELEAFAKIFPNKKIKYSPKLKEYSRAFTHNHFKDKRNETIEYIKDINRETCTTLQIPLPDDIKCLDDDYFSEKDDEKRFTIYQEIQKSKNDFFYNNHNQTEMLDYIGKNTVIYPMAFQESTFEWYKEDHGKEFPAAHAGEVYFVTTDDSVYFTKNRHF